MKNCRERVRLLTTDLQNYRDHVTIQHQRAQHSKLILKKSFSLERLRFPWYSKY